MVPLPDQARAGASTDDNAPKESTPVKALPPGPFWQTNIRLLYVCSSLCVFPFFAGPHRTLAKLTGLPLV